MAEVGLDPTAHWRWVSAMTEAAWEAMILSLSTPVRAAPLQMGVIATLRLVGSAARIGGGTQLRLVDMSAVADAAADLARAQAVAT